MNKKNLSKEQLFEIVKMYDDEKPYAYESDYGVYGIKKLDTAYYFTERAYRVLEYCGVSEGFAEVLLPEQYSYALDVLAENDRERNKFINFDEICKTLRLK